MKPKETPEQRKKRLELNKMTKTKWVPDKKRYDRKRAKSKKDWLSFLFRRLKCTTLVDITFSQVK